MKSIKQIITALALIISATTVIANNEEVTLITPGGPGAFTHGLALEISEPLTAAGVTNTIVAKEGARGTVAVKYLREQKNPNLILVAGGGITKFESILSPTFVSILDDYEFVGPVLETQFWMITSDGTAKSIDDILASDKKYTVGINNGTTAFIVEEFNKKYPGKFISVPYKNSGKVWLDLIGGSIQIAIDRESFYTGKNFDAPGAGALRITNLGSFAANDKLPVISFPGTAGIKLTDNGVGVLMRRDAPPMLKQKVSDALSVYFAANKERYTKRGYTISTNPVKVTNEILTELHNFKVSRQWTH